MNAANVIPLSAPQPFAYGKSASPAALNPVRVRFGRIRTRRGRMHVCRAMERPSLSRRSHSRCSARSRDGPAPCSPSTRCSTTYGATSSSATRFWRPPSARCGRCSTTIPGSRASSKPCPGVAIASLPGRRRYRALWRYPVRRQSGQSTSPSSRPSRSAAKRCRVRAGPGMRLAAASVPLYRLFERSTRRGARRVVLCYNPYSRRWKKCVTPTSYGCN